MSSLTVTRVYTRSEFLRNRLTMRVKVISIGGKRGFLARAAFSGRIKRQKAFLKSDAVQMRYRARRSRVRIDGKV